jgi:TonB family protein
MVIRTVAIDPGQSEWLFHTFPPKGVVNRANKTISGPLPAGRVRALAHTVMHNLSSAPTQRELFSSLEHTASRGTAFSASVVVHIVLIVVLVLVPLIFTETIKKVKWDVVLLVPPQPKKQILEVTPYRQPIPKRVERPPEKVVAPPPRKPFLNDIKPPEPPKVAEAKLPEVIERERQKALPLPKNSLNVAELEPAKPLKPELKTNVFSSGSSAKPTVNASASQVQTGGFGDPNGARGQGRADKAVNIASLGSFDLPTGPGAGNGTGGAKGVKGTVASSGFGNGVVATGNGGTADGGARRAVQQGGFGDANANVPQTETKKRDTGAPQTPVEILFKPRPEYTDAARNMKLEGEVLIKVLFTAAGEVRVIDVIQGLGHGLDQNAIRAAQQIRFKPAQRDGQPVDSTATVHIVFQLAY